MAEKFPERSALVIGDGESELSYAELDARSNQVARALRALDVATGDTIAVMLQNCEEFFEVWWAAMRTGLYLTPINWHLTAPEIAYVLADSEARAVVYSGHLGETVDRAVGGDASVQLIAVGDTELDRAFDHHRLRDAQPTDRVDDELLGAPMFYSSGTTGRPKGIRRPLPGLSPAVAWSRIRATAERFGLDEGIRYLSPGPLYHAAPSLWTTAVHTVGGTSVVMRRFDPEQALLLIAHQHITDSQWVPTMLQRILRLPEEVRNRYDLSSHRRAWTAAAPISVELKKTMIEWWGPILLEYYAASEGGGTIITAEEWLERPGSVGRHYTGEKIYILDPETREELPPGREGLIYFKPQPDAVFEYKDDDTKTAEVHHGQLFTAGDLGYLDDEGYLFLTGRQSDMIVAGGVNVYPREVEEAISSHPAVADVAVFGVPDDDLGERVHAVIQPVDPDNVGGDLLQEVIDHLQPRLARHKIPRTFEVSAQLPRDENGKLYKRLLREPFWEARNTPVV